MLELFTFDKKSWDLIQIYIENEMDISETFYKIYKQNMLDTSNV